MNDLYSTMDRKERILENYISKIPILLFVFSKNYKVLNLQYKFIALIFHYYAYLQSRLFQQSRIKLEQAFSAPPL